MTSIESSLDAVQGQLAETDDVEETTRVEVSQNEVTKATMVLRLLRAAGLKQPFDFNMEEAAKVWATQVGRFGTGVLNDAVQEWISSETVWPTVGEFVTICEMIVTENIRASAEADAKARNPEGKWCEECGVPDEDSPRFGFIRGYNVRWVRVQDAKGGGQHMRPCSLCLPERYDLYSRGHFDAAHVERGGCKECWDFMPGHQGAKKKREPGRIG